MWICFQLDYTGLLCYVYHGISQAKVGRFHDATAFELNYQTETYDTKALLIKAENQQENNGVSLQLE